MVFLALLIPPLLLCLALVMERFERSLREEAVGDEIDEWLERAAPEEIERFVTEGLSRPLDRYWRRHRHGVRAHARRVVPLH